MNPQISGSNGVVYSIYINNHLIVKYPLCIFVSYRYFQPITQQYESRTVQSTSVNKVATMKRKYKWCHMPYQLSSKKWSIHCQICSTHYTAVQIENYSKSTSVIRVATMKIQTVSIAQRKPTLGTTKLTLSKMNGEHW